MYQKATTMFTLPDYSIFMKLIDKEVNKGKIKQAKK